MKLLGIDYGEHRTGVSVTDDDGRIALARETIAEKNRARLLDRLTEMCREDGIGKIIFGLPLTFANAEPPLAARVRQFARKLETRTGVPVDFEDERLTSVMSERLLRDRGEKKKATDADAAVLILQSYLDRQTGKS
ncbi:MAG: Holliday junction resolvase RuvX [Candidatus Kerfeldbacteria bacterium]|nr:Holliday junction resolvase RuvX [Candidatus Kerfeldbacteria bacterium]